MDFDLESTVLEKSTINALGIKFDLRKKVNVNLGPFFQQTW